MSLLITERMRQVPPSGAKVKPVRRTFWICAAVPDGEGVHPQRGQADRNPTAVLGIVDDVAHRVLDAGEVGGRERGERHLVVAGPLESSVHHVAHLLGGALAHRPGDHARLAEAAATGTAPEDLDVEAVVHHLGQRHQGPGRVGPVGQVRHRALGDGGRHRGVDRHGARQASFGVRRLVERRDVDPLERGQPPAQAVARALRLGLGQPVPHHLVDLAHHLLAVAQHEGVDEVGQRFGVEGAVPTGQHQRVGGAPLGRVQRHTGQVDEVDHVGVDELGRQVEGEHVEGGRREVLLDAEERVPRPPASPAPGRPRGRRSARPPRRDAR